MLERDPNSSHMGIDIDNLHHAYFLQGKKEEAEITLGIFFEKLNFRILGNPDLFTYKEDTFGIDDSRNLKKHANSKAFGLKKIFVIYSQLITEEAQNALLKIFEEPTKDTHFFIVNERNILLPTLNSRIQVLKLNENESKNKDADIFLKSSIPLRLEFIKKISKDETFLLSNFVEELIKSLKARKANAIELKTVFNLSKYTLDTAANTRLILEHLALTLPESLE